MIQKIDLNIIKYINNNLRTPFLDYLFYGITQLGDMYFFILLVIILYWLYDKKFAYKFIFTYLVSVFFNATIKEVFKRPRPYEFESIESVFEKTGGYSFPSGHSQASGVIFYNLYDEFKQNKLIKYISIFILFIVPISRIYLAQHFLTDVIVGSILGIISVIVGGKLFNLMKDKEHIYPLYLIPLIIIILIITYNKDFSFNNYLFMGGSAYIGFSFGYYIEKKYIKHKVETNIKTKIFKLIIGLSILVLLFVILNLVLIKESLILSFVKYLILSLYVSMIAPYIFVKLFDNN